MAEKTKARIVFMGTPMFAVPILEACLEIGDVVGVVTQADKPKGRGGQLSAPPIKERALSRGIPVFQPLKIRGTNFASQLRELHPDVCVIAAYGKILPPDVLEVPARGSVNVHASLLPRWRGAAPIQRAIVAGDRETGVCLMQVDEGLDTGPLLACKRIAIHARDTSETLSVKLAELGRSLLVEKLSSFLTGDLPPVPQPEHGISWAPPLRKEEGELSFQRSAAELERMVRGFIPWPGSWVHFEGAILKVHEVRVGSGRGSSGEVLTADSNGIEVACRGDSLWLLEVQPEGKKRMATAAFLASRKVKIGSFPFGPSPNTTAR